MMILANKTKRVNLFLFLFACCRDLIGNIGFLNNFVSFLRFARDTLENK